MKNIVIGVLIFCVIALIALSVALQSGETKPSNGNEEPIACTLEALVCPDGSAVGRSGPSCAFATCPQVPSLVGELEQVGGDFRLILDTENENDMVYTVPLQIEINNALGTLVGKRVRATGAFVEGATFKVASLDALETSMQSVTLTVAVGERGSSNGVMILVDEIISDNRCPSDVTCITGGTVVARITLETMEGTETLDVTLNEQAVAFGMFTVALTEVTPSTLSTEAIEPEAYLLTFTITDTSQ